MIEADESGGRRMGGEISDDPCRPLGALVAADPIQRLGARVVSIKRRRNESGAAGGLSTQTAPASRCVTMRLRPTRSTVGRPLGFH